MYLWYYQSSHSITLMSQYKSLLVLTISTHFLFKKNIDWQYEDQDQCIGFRYSICVFVFYQAQYGTGPSCQSSSEVASSHHLPSPLEKMVHSFP